MTENYDGQVREWWEDKSRSITITLNSFFEIIKEEKVQMRTHENAHFPYQVFQIIEGDTLLVKTTEGYCIFYPRHETFIKLIFPFEESYKEDLLIGYK